VTRDRKGRPSRKVVGDNIIYVRFGEHDVEVRAGYGESVRVQNAIARWLDQPVFIERKQRA
jgi:hypothetical protein